MKSFFLCMIISLLMKWKHFLMVLLSLETGVLFFIFYFSFFSFHKFIFMLIMMVSGSIVGLIMFMVCMKVFSSFYTMVWVY